MRAFFLRGPAALRPAHLILAAVGVAGALAACDVAADRDQIVVTSAADGAPRGAPMAPDPAREERGFALEVAQSRAVKGAAVGASAPPAAQVAAPVDAGTMLIRNGHVVVRVDSLEIAIERVRVLAAALGGVVGNVTVSAGERQVRSATMELKVPAPRFDTAMSGMAPLGRLEHSTTSAQDVGEEFVDISARLANARRLEQRLLALLANRTGRLEDVLAVERELARVREEIERSEGRMRYLASRVATSTIVASLHEPEPIMASPGTNVLGNAFLNMWRNFVRFVAGLIEALGVLVPVALLGIGGMLAWKRWAGSRPGVAKV